MKKPLIEIKQQYSIVCDNPSCDYKVENEHDSVPTPEEYKEYINRPCPKCGENLLTQEDYDNTIKMFNVVNKINKTFSFLKFFAKEKKEKQIEVKVKVHKGFHFS